MKFQGLRFDAACFILVLSTTQTAYSQDSDTNNDGTIDAQDLLFLLSDWMKRVTPREDP